MPTNDREVYKQFYSRKDDPPEGIALAYAGYVKAKYDWVAHVEARRGTPPSSDEVDRWIAELPDSRLDDLRQDAIDFFDLAARAYMAAEIENAVQAARDEAILRDVRASNGLVAARVERATAFGHTFWGNLFVGIVASFVFSLLVIAFAVIFARDPSPLALYRSLQSGRPSSTTQTVPQPGGG